MQTPLKTVANDFQLGGINALIYYSSTIFEKSLGFDKNLSALMSGALNTWFFAASFIPCNSQARQLDLISTNDARVPD